MPGLCLGLAAAASPALAQAPDAEPPRRGLPLEVERGGRLPDVLAPPVAPATPEREGIDELSLDLGPIPREVVIDEDAVAATWKQISALPGTTLGLYLPRGNMIRPGLRRRLATHPAVHLWMKPPLLRVHIEQLKELPGLRQITLWVEAGEDSEALAALERLPPLRLQVWLKGGLDAERVALWATKRRVVLLLEHSAVLQASPATLEALVALGSERLVLVIPAAFPQAPLAPQITTLRPGGVLFYPSPHFLPSRTSLEFLGARGRFLKIQLGPGIRAEELQTLKGLPRLRLGLWLPGAKRKEARRALHLLEKTLGDRKPR